MEISEIELACNLMDQAIILFKNGSYHCPFPICRDSTTLREAENRVNKHGGKSSAKCLRDCAGIVSGPVSLDGPRSFRRLVIQEICKSIAKIS